MVDYAAVRVYFYGILKNLQYRIENHVLGRHRLVCEVKRIADALGVTDQAIYNRVSAGEFDGGPQPVARLGVAIRIPVDTFLWWKERFFDNAEYERPPKEN